VTFHDLRGDGRDAPRARRLQIATIAGHSLREVRTILDSNYLSRDRALGESAIRKLERRTKTPDCARMFCLYNEER
jgi:hypothetical protein